MIRNVLESDADAVLRINRMCVPAVGPMDAARVEFFLRVSPFFRVVEMSGAVVGFMVGLSEDSSAYSSLNYQWFYKRHARFAYVDRIALDGHVRGQKLGRQLYDAFHKWALEHGKDTLCAEVNTLPDNPGSHRFHRRYGFAEVARLSPYDPCKEVAMYEKTIV